MGYLLQTAMIIGAMILLTRGIAGGAGAGGGGGGGGGFGGLFNYGQSTAKLISPEQMGVKFK